MNFINISIIFAFLTLFLNVLSSPIRHCIIKSSKSTNNTEVSNLKLDPVSDSDTEVEISSNDLDIANTADIDFEVETDSGVETETETETETTSDFFTEECLTPECYEISKSILSRMDITADPCEDFYQFSCGGWMNENEIPKGEISFDTFGEIANNNEKILRQILEGKYQINKNLSPEDQELDKEIFNKIKTIYATCMDVDAINKQGLKPLINLLNQFDLYNNKAKYESVDEFTNLIADIHDYGISYIFGYTVGVDLINTEINVMQVSQPQILYSDQLKNEEFISLILETLKALFDDQKNKRNIEEMADKIIEFEKQLSDILIPNDQLQSLNDLFHPTTVGELMNVYPNINWKLYINKRFKNYDIKTSVNDDTYIINLHPKYLEALNKLLDETDIDSLIYYAEWCIISQLIVYLSDDSDTEEIQERYKTCIDHTNKMMGNALGKYFVEKTFTGNSMEEVKEMISNIKQAMLNRILETSWLDQTTFDEAINKVNKITFDNIGYPVYILKPKELIKDYEGFEVDSEVLFNTIINYGKFIVRKKIKSIDEPVKSDEWIMNPQTVNANYYPIDNTMFFTAGVLQQPFYNVHQPDYINYGFIGSIIGHELTHAFDNSGRLFDANGVYRNWWTNSTTNQFENLSTCFIEQYDQYKMVVNDEEINIDGKQTLGENLADNGGINRSLEAWKLSRKDKKKFNERNKALPGLSDFTAEQLFYVSFGQIYCEKRTPESLKHQILTNEHSPGKYRIIGTLSNNENFAKVFNCPKNSPMNPEKKCLLW